MKPFEYAIAENERGAMSALSAGYRIKANGIDLLDMLKERIKQSDRFVSIATIDSLRGIEEDGPGLLIRPLATLKQIGNNELVKRRFAALAHAAGEAATPQIRAVATAGGNLCQRPRCWYFRSKEYHCLKKGGSTCFAADGENSYHAIFGEGPCHIVHPSNIAPALVAANAAVDVISPSQERSINLNDFFVMPDKNIYGENVLKEDELITGIRVPKLPEKSAYVEFREKQSFDWPLTACAAVLVDGKWNVVMGAVAPIPWRAKGAEEVLAGAASITPELAAQAAEAAVADATPLSQNAYRIRMARAAVRRALLKADGKDVFA